MTDAAACMNVGLGVNKKSNTLPITKVYRLVGLPEKLEICGLHYICGIFASRAV